MSVLLLSSVCYITIITLVMERYRTVGVCSRVSDESTWCTGCTTFVPRTNTACGTPENGPGTGFYGIKHEVYQMYQYRSVSFSNRPWTVVIESLFDSLNNRYKWYKDHETQLPHGFQLYHLTFVTGTPFTEKVVNIRVSAVPLCTTNSDGKRSEAPWGALGSAGEPQILLRRISSMVVYVINYLILWRYYGNFTKSSPRGIHGMVFYY